jgi:putative acetyltransferase
MLLPLTLQGVRGILPENSSLALPFCGAINSSYVSIFVMSNAMSVITPVATTMRRIAEQDNPAIAAVIRTVSAEYGLTADKGYTVADPNLDELFQLYSQPGMPTGYRAERSGRGRRRRGAPQLQRAGYLRTAENVFSANGARTRAGEKAGADGAGPRAQAGFYPLLPETTAFLKEAIGLYEHLGFEHIDAPLGCTGHVDCEVRMLKSL